MFRGYNQQNNKHKVHEGITPPGNVCNYEKRQRFHTRKRLGKTVGNDMKTDFFSVGQSNLGCVGKKVGGHGAADEEQYNGRLHGPGRQACGTKHISANRQSNDARKNQYGENIRQDRVIIGDSRVAQKMKVGDECTCKVIHCINGKHKKSPDNQQMQNSSNGFA